MRINRIDHIGVIVKDLAAATAFFLDFGLEVQGEAAMEGDLSEAWALAVKGRFQRNVYP